MLSDHARQLAENIAVIKCRGSSQWPSAPANSDSWKKADAAANTLLRDFEHLLLKTENLSKRCEKGMSVIMNNANIAESKRAISQAEKVGKLTLLAFFYVPLSFTTSFFGMNFRQFSSGPTLGIWLWFAVSVPVLALSVLFFVWDIPDFLGKLTLHKRLQQW